MSEKKLTFSTTAFQNIKSKMDELHILLTPNKEHKKVYPKVSVVGFQNGKTLNPLSANPTKWSNTLKQFVGNLLMNCLRVFDHFVKLALKGLRITWLEPNYSNLRSAEDVNHVRKKLTWSKIL